MTNITTLLRQLEAYVQEEIGAQARLVDLLETQHVALREHHPERILATTLALDRVLDSGVERARRRNELVAALARVWGVASSALTLSSIIQRAGDDADRLARQKEELERTARRARTLARRATTAARFHQRLSAEVLEAVLASGAGGDVSAAGSLVNAEA